MIIVHNADWHILLAPVLILLLAFYALGLGLMVSVFNVFYRDIGYLVAITLNVLFYATPIIYNYDTQVAPKLVNYPWAGYLFQLNPLTQFVAFSRDLFWDQRLPGLGSFAYMTFMALATFRVGWWVFNRKARRPWAKSCDPLMSSDNIAIRVDDVSKMYRKYTERSTSLKERITKVKGDRYEEFWALKDVSLEIAEGRVLRPRRPQRLGQVDAAAR